MPPIQISRIDLAQSMHARALVDLLDHYARDPMGGGEPLSEEARARLPGALARFAGYHGALAFAQDRPVGVINCFTGFSTFTARPLLNIHDVAVHAQFRRQGVGAALLRWAQEQATALGCCKLTLEVLSLNRPAMDAYLRAGFVPYSLDPASGQALFMHKILEPAAGQ